MGVKKFEDLIARQKAQDLACLIYANFGFLKDHGFKDQITRASVSISNNIAEGFDRKSSADFSCFSYCSIGSANEVKSMTYLTSRLEYLEKDNAQKLIASAEEVSKVIRGRIKSLKPND